MASAKTLISTALAVSLIFSGPIAHSAEFPLFKIPGIPGGQSKGNAADPKGTQSDRSSSTSGVTAGAGSYLPQKPSNQAGSADSLVPWLLGAAAIAGAFALQKFLQKPPDSATLRDYGPQFPDEFSMSEVAVHGFIKGGWPIVIEYEPAPRSKATIELRVHGRVAQSYPLDTAKPGKRYVLFNAPDEIGDELQVGTFVLKALQDEGERSVLDDRPRSEELAPFRLYSLGAGPGAVGSVAIENVAMKPTEVRQDAKAGYQFLSRKDFKEAYAKFRPIKVKQGGAIYVGEVVQNDKLNSINKGWYPGPDPSGIKDWERKQIQPGDYLLSIYAWTYQDGWLWGSNSDDWVKVLR